MASESDDGLPRHIIVMGLPMGSKQTPKIHQWVYHRTAGDGL